MTPDNALQAGVFDRLTGYTPLTAALGGPKVYDFVPQGTAAPYVVIGDDTSADWDTKTQRGWEFTLTIHCWDFHRQGRKSVKTLLGHVAAALHQQEASVTVSGYALVQIRCEFQQTFQDISAEGQTDQYYHGVARYRALVTT